MGELLAADWLGVPHPVENHNARPTKQNGSYGDHREMVLVVPRTSHSLRQTQFPHFRKRHLT